MDKWEYYIISVEIAGGKIRKEVKDYERVEEVLDEAGEEGWELVSVIPYYEDSLTHQKGLITLFLKRKIE